MRFSAARPAARALRLSLVSATPTRPRLKLEFRQLATMDRLDVRVGIASERSQERLLGILLGDPDHPPDGSKVMMAQPQRDNLLFALGYLLLGLRRARVATSAFRPSTTRCALSRGIRAREYRGATA
jgi:hypothetical protein